MEDKKHMPADSCKANAESATPAVPSNAAAERERLEPAAARRHARRARAYIALVMVALAATLGAATYAWFTNNMKVNTNSVSVHSDTSKLVLELGDADAGNWSQQGDASLASTASGPRRSIRSRPLTSTALLPARKTTRPVMPRYLSRQKTTAPPTTTAGSTCAPPLPERAPAK